MRFHGLMLLRDEADIIAETLNHLLTWIDVLHIYDLGSTDETWDIVQDFAKRDSRIKPFKNEPTVYQDGLRCVMFDELRGGFEKGDWIMKIDADEFHLIPPPQFAKERLHQRESMVHLQWYFFRLTTDEAVAYESGAVSVKDDRMKSIIERRRFYKVSQYSEPRMFRYRPTMQWASGNYLPYNAGLLARERLPILHYPHRDPVQLTRRFALRTAMMQFNAAAGSHWKAMDWRNELVDISTGVSVGVKNGSIEGLAGENGIDTGPIMFWEEGTSLTEVHLHHQVASLSNCLRQRVIYNPLLPIVDMLRPKYDRSYRPTLISEKDNNQIGILCNH